MTYYCDTHRHLVCKPYSISALHQMAQSLSIGKHWFHGGKHPHYDIPKRREKQIMEQCEVITSKELFQIIHNND